MREKWGMAAFVLLLVAVWGIGFLWFRGDLTGGSSTAASSGATEAKRAVADAASPGSEASSSASSAPSATPSGTPSNSPAATPEGGAKAYTGTVTPRQERRPVNLNPPIARPQPLELPPVADFTLASFNLLGSTHTKAGGHTPRLASGPQRLRGAMQILAKHQITVVGFQEFQPDQRNTFNRIARGWEMYPGLRLGRRAGENSVAWRSDTWEMVDPGLVPIPYFNGRIRPMPFVLLRHKETGVQAYFSTFHNPANIGGNQQRHRNEATRRQIRLFNQLERGGTPQFVTGDMNERTEYFCKVTGNTPLTAAAGGSNGGGCRPPRPTQIDWIFGSPGAEWTRYVVDRSPLVRRTTDHPVIVASVKVDALNFENGYAPVAPPS